MTRPIMQPDAIASHLRQLFNNSHYPSDKEPGQTFDHAIESAEWWMRYAQRLERLVDLERGVNAGP